MSRSPRKVLRSAAEALDAVHDLCEQHPEARDEIVRSLGGDAGLAAVEAARHFLREATVSQRGAPAES